MKLAVYTDGGCLGNPGPGAWAYLVLHSGGKEERSGYESSTTNNRMELTAVIRALEEIESTDDWGDAAIELNTDSQYVHRGITEWIAGWMRNGWITSGKKPVKNRDLWQNLKSISDGLQIKWNWVRGHHGHEYNERCDEMVRKEMLSH